MKQLLNQELVLFSELKPLTGSEKNILLFLRNKKLFYIISSYLAFLGVLILAWFKAESDWINDYGRDDEEEMVRFYKLAPWVFAAIFAGLSAFFANYYFRLVHPYVKDKHKRMKEIIYFRPERYQTPLFAEYYILTPANQKPTVKISREIFDEIDPASKASISLGQFSRFVFEIEVDGRKINFNETHEPVDI